MGIDNQYLKEKKDRKNSRMQSCGSRLKGSFFMWCENEDEEKEVKLNSTQ